MLAIVLLWRALLRRLRGRVVYLVVSLDPDGMFDLHVVTRSSRRADLEFDAARRQRGGANVALFSTTIE